MLPALCTLGVLVAPAAQAALSTVGPVQDETGFPRFYGDSTGLRLELCLDRTANCLAEFPDPAAPASFPDNFPDESFYWDGTADIAIPGPAGPGSGSALYVAAVEAAFATEVAAGDQIAFQRIRLRIRGGFANQDYTFTHPYGSKKIKTDANGIATDTVDVGCFSFPCDFSQVLRGAVGPFLKWSATAPAPPAGYIGDPGVPHTVTGSPTGNNFVRVNGGGNTGLPQPSGTNPGGLSTNLFAIQGKIDTGPTDPPPPATRTVSLQPASLFFAARDIATTSAAQNVNLTNTGTATLDIASIAIAGANPADYAKGAPANGSTNPACGATLASNATCTVSVTFTPTAAGSRPASLTFTDNAGNTAGTVQTVPLSGTGNGPADATLLPGTLAFGNQNVTTTSAPQTATLKNTGGAPLTVSNIATPAGYSKSGGTCTTTTTLAPGGTCTIDVTFTPTADGPNNGTLTVTDNAASGATQTVALTGNGVTPAPTAPVASPGPAVAFPATQAGQSSATQNATLTNTGNAPLSIASVAKTGLNQADFAIVTNGCPASLAAGATCSVAVAFRPLTAGAGKTALVRFTDDSNNAPGSTQDVVVSGDATAAPATAPGITVNPTSLTFTARAPALLRAGTTQDQTVTVTSSGTAALTVSAAIGAAPSNSFPANYSILSNACTGLRAPGSTCTITVRFRPTARGARNAALNLTTNAAGSPTKVALNGTGT